MDFCCSRDRRRRKRLAKILQFFYNPGNRFICACSEEAFDFINGFGIENIDLVHHNIPADCLLKTMLKTG